MITIFGFSPYMFVLIIFDVIVSLVIRQVFRLNGKKTFFVFAAILFLLIALDYLIWTIFIEPSIGTFSV